MMQVVIIISLLVSIGMPLFFVWRVWCADEPSRAGWLLLVVEATAFVTLVLLLGRWDVAGYSLRLLLPVLLVVAIVRSAGRHRARPWASPILRTHWTTLISASFFCIALAWTVSGVLPPDEPRELSFPLKGGRFVVGQGGEVMLLNHHAGHPEQDDAVDITALGRFGFRAEGILPADLDRYAIFGAAVLSPCAGYVVDARDGLPDLVPPNSDPDVPAGNSVAIDCGGVHVLLAHLRQGSVAVRAGQLVGTGDAIGRVGNSGNTTEPHLHVHAFDPATGTGVPISFDGRVPVRNRLYAN